MRGEKHTLLPNLTLPLGSAGHFGADPSKENQNGMRGSGFRAGAICPRHLQLSFTKATLPSGISEFIPIRPKHAGLGARTSEHLKLTLCYDIELLGGGQKCTEPVTALRQTFTVNRN